MAVHGSWCVRGRRVVVRVVVSWSPWSGDAVGAGDSVQLGRGDGGEIPAGPGDPDPVRVEEFGDPSWRVGVVAVGAAHGRAGEQHRPGVVVYARARVVGGGAPFEPAVGAGCDGSWAHRLSRAAVSTRPTLEVVDTGGQGIERGGPDRPNPPRADAPRANAALRAARLARPSPRDRSRSLSRAELAELAAAEVHARSGRVAPLDAHYVARLERGAIRWPGADYRAAFAAVLDVPEGDLGFHCPRPAEVPVPYPDDDGLLALAARAETSEVGVAAVAALEEVADLLARAYATTHPQLLLDEVRRRATEVSALLDRRLTLVQRRRLLVVGGWLALLGATVRVDLGDRAGAASARAAAASLG